MTKKSKKNKEKVDDTIKNYEEIKCNNEENTAEKYLNTRKNSIFMNLTHPLTKNCIQNSNFEINVEIFSALLASLLYQELNN